ncbi:MAG: hypothetical protein IJU41_03805 [Clostridia bacterium]|nr:hypothetical protein [Clostridia bacterium]
MGSIPVRVTIKNKGMPNGIPLFLILPAVESNLRFAQSAKTTATAGEALGSDSRLAFLYF